MKPLRLVGTLAQRVRFVGDRPRWSKWWCTVIVTETCCSYCLCYRFLFCQYMSDRNLHKFF